MQSRNLLSCVRSMGLLTSTVAVSVLAGLVAVGGCEDDTMRTSINCFDQVVGRGTSVASRSIENTQEFEWYPYLGSHDIAESDVLILEFAIIPFPENSSRGTSVGLDTSEGNTFLSLTFDGGNVDGVVPYNQSEWNCVEVRLDYAEQTYVFEVNGRRAGPYSFEPPSMNVGSFRVNYWSDPLTTTAGISRTCWLDSISLRRQRNWRTVRLFEQGFDGEVPYQIFTGTLVADSPPGD